MDPIDASKQAAGASVMCKPGKAQDHAMDALQAAHSEDPQQATDMHLKAAAAHDRMAMSSRSDDDHQDADMNHQAADMHRRAAGFHKAGMTENELNDGQESGMLTTNQRILQIVENFNPYHDEKGQFTSGGSGGALKGAQKASDKAMSTGKESDHAKAAALPTMHLPRIT